MYVFGRFRVPLADALDIFKCFRFSGVGERKKPSNRWQGHHQLIWKIERRRWWGGGAQRPGGCLLQRGIRVKIFFESKLDIIPLNKKNVEFLAWRIEIAAIFAIYDRDAHRRPKKSQRFPRQEKAILHCDLRAHGKSLAIWDFGLQFQSPKPFFCRIFW